MTVWIAVWAVAGAGYVAVSVGRTWLRERALTEQCRAEEKTKTARAREERR